MKETELYKPVKQLFEDMGYEVNSEVNDIDVTAVKDEELVIVELKANLNLKLYIQAGKRQRLTDKVYVAVPKPEWKKMCSKDWKDRIYLLKRLELGLIYVSVNRKVPVAEVAFEPLPFSREISMRRSKGKRKKALNEIRERHGDYNTGGSKGQKLVTAYRENALLIARCLEINGEMYVKEIREMGGGSKTLSILNKNYYGWFERVDRGRYRLSEKGIRDIERYREVINKLTNQHEEYIINQ